MVQNDSVSLFRQIRPDANGGMTPARGLKVSVEIQLKNGGCRMG